MSNRTIKLSQSQLRKIISSALQEGFFDEEEPESKETEDETEPGFGFDNEEKDDHLSSLVGDRNADWRREKFESKKRPKGKSLKEAFQRITAEEIQAWKKGDYSNIDEIGKNPNMHAGWRGGPAQSARFDDGNQIHGENPKQHLGRAMDYAKNALDITIACLDNPRWNNNLSKDEAEKIASAQEHLGKVIAAIRYILD